MRGTVEGATGKPVRGDGSVQEVSTKLLQGVRGAGARGTGDQPVAVLTWLLLEKIPRVLVRRDETLRLGAHWRRRGWHACNRSGWLDSNLAGRLVIVV